MTIDSRFRVDLIAATPNPQRCIYAALHQDYSEGYVFDDRANWPEESRAGEICVKRLLAGDRAHYGPLEHGQIVLNVGWFPHSAMQQARTHLASLAPGGPLILRSQRCMVAPLSTLSDCYGSPSTALIRGTTTLWLGPFHLS